MFVHALLLTVNTASLLSRASICRLKVPYIYIYMYVCMHVCSSPKVVDGEDELHSCMPFLTILWFELFFFKKKLSSHAGLCRFSVDKNKNEMRRLIVIIITISWLL